MRRVESPTTDHHPQSEDPHAIQRPCIFCRLVKEQSKVYLVGVAELPHERPNRTRARALALEGKALHKSKRHQRKADAVLMQLERQEQQKTGQSESINSKCQPCVCGQSKSRQKSVVETDPVGRMAGTQ